MGTGLRRDDTGEGLTIKGLVEEQRGDTNGVLGERLEDRLRVVRAVVVAQPGVVAPDDEVRAAEVLAHQGMEPRLPRAGVAHRRRVDGQHYAVPRIVVL